VCTAWETCPYGVTSNDSGWHNDNEGEEEMKRKKKLIQESTVMGNLINLESFAFHMTATQTTRWHITDDELTIQQYWKGPGQQK